MPQNNTANSNVNMATSQHSKPGSGEPGRGQLPAAGTTGQHAANSNTEYIQKSDLTAMENRIVDRVVAALKDILKMDLMNQMTEKVNFAVKDALHDPTLRIDALSTRQTGVEEKVQKLEFSLEDHVKNAIDSQMTAQMDKTVKSYIDN